MKNAPETNLSLCPFCGKHLRVRNQSTNPYGICETDDCWLSSRSIAIPLHDPVQVRQFNTRHTAVDKAAKVYLEITKLAPEIGALVEAGDKATQGKWCKHINAHSNIGYTDGIYIRGLCFFGGGDDNFVILAANTRRALKKLYELIINLSKKEDA